MSVLRIAGMAAAFAGVILAASAPTAMAAVQIGAFGSDISGNVNEGPINFNIQRATLTCTASDGVSAGCQGYIYVPVASRASFDPGPGTDTPSPGTLDNNRADLYRTQNSGDATELSILNSVTGSSFTLADFSKSGSGVTSLQTTAPYFLAVIGSDPRIGVFKNITGGLINISWAGLSGQGAGLSHFSFVPLPAALPLFLAGLAGLGFVGWRRRAA